MKFLDIQVYERFISGITVLYKYGLNNTFQRSEASEDLKHIAAFHKQYFIWLGLHFNTRASGKDCDNVSELQCSF